MADIIPFEPNPQAAESVSEMWAARQFANEHGGELAFCHSRGGWYLFDGFIWKFQETPLAFHYIREMVERMSMAAKNKMAIQKSAFLKGVEAIVRADPIFAAKASDWDTDIWLLGTPGGTVDLKTGELRKPSRADKITKSTAVEPAHPDSIEATPVWSNFLAETTGGDHELIRFLQQICGYALTGDISEQMLFFIFGTGGNGKGTFLRALQNILGDYSVVAPMEALEKQKFTAHTTDLAMMQGARLVSASESDEGGEWNEKRIKALTGGDKITARFMNRNNITFTPQLTLLVIGNHKPALRSVDEAMRRRFNMIPFAIKPLRQDIHLDDKIQIEWSGVLRWMIEGCLDWQKNGFVIPASVRGATEKYFEEQDLMGEWIRDYCDVDRSDGYMSERASMLFASWAKFAKASAAEAGSTRTFKPALERLGFKHKKFDNGMHYLNIRLKSSNPDNFNDDPFGG